MVDPVQLAFGRVLREHALIERLRADPHAVLAELGLDEPTRARVLASGVERLVAYHEMVHSRLLRTVREFSPRATTLIGARLPGVLPGVVHDWIAERGPSSPYLREVPYEFLAWARPRWREAIARGELPEWTIELFEHELEHRLLLRDDRSIAPPSSQPVGLEHGMLGNATARLLRREFAVHRLPAKLDLDAGLPEVARGSFTLVGWRDRDDKPRFLELRARHAALLERLIAGQTLRDALFGACAALGESLDDTILGDTAVTLAKWCDDQLLLGAT
ncbi:hypothetical protein ACNOYE_20265 [Nannocystaceae bacterium ST9]